MLLVGRRAKARQGLEDRVPHPELAPAGKAREHRVPIAVSLGKVAPRRACAQNPKDAVDRSPLERNGWAALAPIGEQGIENVPVRVRQISPTQCCLPKKGSLESLTYEKIVNTPYNRYAYPYSYLGFGWW
jgi:hypothetical protein